MSRTVPKLTPLHVLFGLCVCAAAGRAAGGPEELTRAAQLVFRGTIQKVEASNLENVRADSSTAVVRVDEVLKAAPGLGDFTGREITVKDLLTHVSGLASGTMSNSTVQSVARKQGEKLADSDTYAAAKSVLGDIEPGFLLSVPAVLELVEASGEADEDFAKAKPYLEAFGVLAGGNSRDGDTARSRTAVGLR